LFTFVFDYFLEHGYPLPAPTVRRRKEIKLHPHGKVFVWCALFVRY